MLRTREKSKVVHSDNFAVENETELNVSESMEGDQS